MKVSKKRKFLAQITIAKSIISNQWYVVYEVYLNSEFIFISNI